MKATMLDETGHRGETEYEFHLLAEYFEISETAIKEIEKSETKRLKEAHAGAKEENEIALAGMEFFELAGKFVREFPLRLRYGFIVQLYSLFETRARGLCEVLVERGVTSATAKLSKEPQGFVFTFRDWIKKNTQGMSDRWPLVEELRLVRNCVAHANGLVEEATNREKLYNVLQLDKGAYQDEFGYIAIEKRFCETACEESLALLNDIYQTTNFGAPFFLRERQLSEIAVSIQLKDDGATFGVIYPDQDLDIPKLSSD